MRKQRYPHGNVGDTTNAFDATGRRRCNICNFCSGIDGNRQMFKDIYDPTGGFVCSKCVRSTGHTPLSQMDEADEWLKEAEHNSRRTVDEAQTFDDKLESLVDDWDKENS